VGPRTVVDLLMNKGNPKYLQGLTSAIG